MPYIFDPVSYSYVYYAEGSPPPQVGTSGQEVVPGYSEYYYDTFPNQPASQQASGNTGATSNSSSSSSSSSSTGSNGDLTTEQRNAYEYLRQLFSTYGLESLAPKILEYVQQGYQSDTISLMLQDTDEYKTRFKANTDRTKSGLPVLSPAEYISLEASYRQILESQGLPKGFYDSQDDFTSWIAGNVSPSEIQERATLASQAVNNSDPNYLSSLREYGLGQGDLVAAMLDQKRALPLLEKTVREAQIGAEARRQGLGLDQSRAAYFESLGVDQSQAQTAYQIIGQNLGNLQQLGQIYNQEYGQADFENELLGKSGLASQKRALLQGKEEGAFNGTSAVGQQTLAGKSRGQF